MYPEAVNTKPTESLFNLFRLLIKLRDIPYENLNTAHKPLPEPNFPTLLFNNTEDPQPQTPQP